MADKVLITADRNNFEDCIELAVEYGLGVEVMAFAYPDVLDGNWEHKLATYRNFIRYVPGPVTIHGPFMDMVSGSPDTRINQVCFQRYQHAIHIAAELGASIVNLHANYIGSLHNTAYRDGWHQRNVIFWYPLAEFARQHNVTITLENMWEFEPTIIADILREVNHSNLKACIDVGHAHVWGDKKFTFQDWLDVMKPWLVHMHMNNNNGVLDEHHGFDWKHGVLNYHDVLKQVRALGIKPTMVLEMYHVQDMRDSLYYFNLSDEPASDTVPAAEDGSNRTIA